jgi:hypothetical protein
MQLSLSASMQWGLGLWETVKLLSSKKQDRAVFFYMPFVEEFSISN